jgi:hypothetical protein
MCSIIKPSQKLSISCGNKGMDKMNKIFEENIHEAESPARNSSDEVPGEMKVEDLAVLLPCVGAVK